MKHLAFSTAALLALTLMGGCSNNNTTTTDDNTTTPTTPTALSCTVNWDGATFSVPTAEQLAAYAGEYVGEEGTYDDFFNFTATGDALIDFADTGVFTYNGTVYSATQTCYIPADNMIYLEFENGAHVDLFTDFAFSGISPVDGITIIRSNLPI